MYSGGEEQTSDALRLMRFANVISALFVSLYAVVIAAGNFQVFYPVSIILATVAAYLYIFSAVYFYLFPAKNKLQCFLRLFSLHALFLSLCAFFIGFSSPLLVAYVLLLFESYLFFGRRGVIFSVGALWALAFVQIILQSHPSLIFALENVTASFLVTFIGLALIRLVQSQETNRRILIHSQEQERLQYDRMTTIMNNLSDAAIATDKNGTVLIYNAACLNVLDTNDSIKGKQVASLFSLTNTENMAVSFSEILENANRTIVRDDLRHTYKDGESIRLEITFSPIRSSYSLHKNAERLGGYIIIFRDITKQKSLEEQRDEFISVVSHELRTPITIVEGTLSNLSLMMQQPKTPAMPVITDSVKTAHDQVLYLARMVNDLSTLSRAERGVADAPELIDVAELLHSMHHQYEKDAGTRKLHLNLELGTKLGSVSASRLYLEELLQNFITNGIKYTNEGSVTIIAKRQGKMVLFAVKDSGIGISRSDQQKVFNKFFRSEDYRIRETNGTGLGLYVASQLAKKLSTKINLTSRLNHGSTFSFELPVEPDAPSK